MKRRTILKSLISAPIAATTLQAQRAAQAPATDESARLEMSVPDAAAEPVVRFFTRDQFAALARLAEILEPSTADLPGAREAHSAEFLDFLISQSPAPRQQLYRSGLDRLDSEATRRYGRGFASIDAAQAGALLEPLHRAWTYEDPADPFEHFLRDAKADVQQATRNSLEFISVAAKRSRGASGVGEFWYPLY